jgi:hypothetical protein
VTRRKCPFSRLFISKRIQSRLTLQLAGMFVTLDSLDIPAQSPDVETALGSCASGAMSLQERVDETHHTAKPGCIGWPSWPAWPEWLTPKTFFSSLGIGDERLRLSHEGGCSSGGDKPADIGGGVASWKSPPILRRGLARAHTYSTSTSDVGEGECECKGGDEDAEQTRSRRGVDMTVAPTPRRSIVV